MFANFIGCDGERVYYDGSSMVTVNGDVVSELLSINLLAFIFDFSVEVYMCLLTLLAVMVRECIMMEALW